ncbi:MAG: hypothetical protein JWM68_4012 [Verrucomicrobiales bacterium]|nr:hypothetical protein [Verrucomicrobiales bacterium]
MFELLAGKQLDGWTAFFLATTVATSVTGFFFPFHHFTPAHAVGIISLLVLAATIYARYARHLAGGWRKTYVVGAAIALYLNVFVGIVQAFLKIPALKELAPTQSEAARPALSQNRRSLASTSTVSIFARPKPCFS